MTQKELKTQIEDKSLIFSCLIFKYTDNSFIAMDYAKAIASNNGLKIVEIDSLDDLKTAQDDDALFESDTANLYIYKPSDLNIPAADLSTYKNLIIITDKVSDKLQSESFFVEIAPLIGWQIEDYLQMRLPGLNSIQIKWLCEISKYNIYRLDNECRKIEIFPETSQSLIFDAINSDDGYMDLNTLSIFDLTNAVMKKDRQTISKILEKIRYVDVEPTGLVTIFRQQLHKLIEIQLNPKATPAELGISPKQFSAIKYSLSGIYNQSQLVDTYSFITEIDYKLKNGDLQFSRNSKDNNYSFIDYIITQMLTIGNRQGNTL